MEANEIIPRVLYLDDDPDALALFQARVESTLGVIVDCAGSAAGAERMLNARCYDLVVSDVSLPGELGTRILQRVLETDPTQPVLLLTAYDRRDSVLRTALELKLPIFSKMEMSEPEFITLLRSLLATRPCPEVPGSTVASPDSAQGDSEQSFSRKKSRTALDIRLTSPLVAAARAHRAA